MRRAARVQVGCVRFCWLPADSITPRKYECLPPDSASQADTTRYHLTGRVISVDKRANSVMIDGDDIPGFMSAMQMPYNVKDATILGKLNPGDQIVVPYKLPTGAFVRGLRDWSQIVSQLAVTGVVLSTVLP